MIDFETLCRLRDFVQELFRFLNIAIIIISIVIIIIIPIVIIKIITIIIIINNYSPKWR